LISGRRTGAELAADVGFRTHRTIDSRTTTLRRWPITARRVNYGW